METWRAVPSPAGEPEKALPEAQAAIRNGPKIIQGYLIAREQRWWI